MFVQHPGAGAFPEPGCRQRRECPGADWQCAAADAAVCRVCDAAVFAVWQSDRHPDRRRRLCRTDAADPGTGDSLYLSGDRAGGDPAWHGKAEFFLRQLSCRVYDPDLRAADLCTHLWLLRDSCVLLCQQRNRQSGAALDGSAACRRHSLGFTSAAARNCTVCCLAVRHAAVSAAEIVCPAPVGGAGGVSGAGGGVYLFALRVLDSMEQQKKTRNTSLHSVSGSFTVQTAPSALPRDIPARY